MAEERNIEKEIQADLQALNAILADETRAADHARATQFVAALTDAMSPEKTGDLATRYDPLKDQIADFIERPSPQAFSQQVLGHMQGKQEAISTSIAKGSAAADVSRMFNEFDTLFPSALHGIAQRDIALALKQDLEGMRKTDEYQQIRKTHEEEQSRLPAGVERQPLLPAIEIMMYMQQAGITNEAQLQARFPNVYRVFQQAYEEFQSMVYGDDGELKLEFQEAFGEDVYAENPAQCKELLRLAFNTLFTMQYAQELDITGTTMLNLVGVGPQPIAADHDPAREIQLTSYIEQLGAAQDALEAEKGELTAADHVKYSVLYARAYQALAHNAASFQDAVFYLDLMMRHVEYLRDYNPALLSGYTQANVARGDYVADEEQFVHDLAALERRASLPGFTQALKAEPEAQTLVLPKTSTERVQRLDQLIDFNQLVRFIREQAVDNPLYQGLLTEGDIQPDIMAAKVADRITDDIRPEQKAEAEALLKAIQTLGSMLRQDDLMSPEGPIQTLADLKAFVQANEAAHVSIYAGLAEHIDPPNPEAFSLAIKANLAALEASDADYVLRAEADLVEQAFDRLYDYHLAAEQGPPSATAKDARMAELQQVDTLDALKAFVDNNRADPLYSDLPDPAANPNAFIEALEGKPQVEPEVLMLKAQYYQAKVNRVHDDTDETLLQDVQDLYQAAYYYHLLDRDHYPGDERYADRVADLCAQARGKGQQISGQSWLGRAAYERRAARAVPEAERTPEQQEAAELTASEKAQKLNSLGSALETPFKRDRREYRLRRRVRGAEKLSRTAESVGDRVSAARRAGWSNVRMKRALANATDRVEVNAGVNVAMGSLHEQGVWASLPLAVYMNPVRYPAEPYKPGTYIGAYNYRALSAAVKSQAALVNPASYSQQDLYAQYEALTTDPVDTPIEATIRAQMMYVEAMDRKTKGDLNNCDGPEEVAQYVRVSLELARNLYAQEGPNPPAMYKEMRNHYLQRAKALAATAKNVEFDLDEPMARFVSAVAALPDTNKFDAIRSALPVKPVEEYVEPTAEETHAALAAQGVDKSPRQVLDDVLGMLPSETDEEVDLSLSEYEPVRFDAPMDDTEEPSAQAAAFAEEESVTAAPETSVAEELAEGMKYDDSTEEEFEPMDLYDSSEEQSSRWRQVFRETKSALAGKAPGAVRSFFATIGAAIATPFKMLAGSGGAGQSVEPEYRYVTPDSSDDAFADDSELDDVPMEELSSKSLSVQATYEEMLEKVQDVKAKYEAEKERYEECVRGAGDKRTDQQLVQLRAARQQAVKAMREYAKPLADHFRAEASKPGPQTLAVKQSFAAWWLATNMEGEEVLKNEAESYDTDIGQLEKMVIRSEAFPVPTVEHTSSHGMLTEKLGGTDPIASAAGIEEETRLVEEDGYKPDQQDSPEQEDGPVTPDKPTLP